MIGKLADAAAMADLDAGLEYLKKQPVVFTNSVGCMGFCRGGDIPCFSPRIGRT